MGEFLEGFCDPVLGQPVVAEQVMRHDDMAVGVAHERAVRVLAIDLAPRVINAFDLLRGKEDVVVCDLGAKRPRAGIVVPLLANKTLVLVPVCGLKVFG